MPKAGRSRWDMMAAPWGKGCCASLQARAPCDREPSRGSGRQQQKILSFIHPYGDGLRFGGRQFLGETPKAPPKGQSSKTNQPGRSTGETGRLGSEAFAVHALAEQLAGAADSLGLLAGALLRRLLIAAAQLHLAKNAFALHLLLERAERLIDIVVADQNVDDGTYSLERNRRLRAQGLMPSPVLTSLKTDAPSTTASLTLKGPVE